VNLVAVDVAGDGNVMSKVFFDGIGIVDHQHFLVFVGDNHRAGAGFDALLRALFRTGVGSLNATLRVATQPFTVLASLANDTEAISAIKAAASDNKITFRMSSSSGLPHIPRDWNFIIGGAVWPATGA
jgi:hypothetical protein